jgi:hypothetical protein
MSLIKLAITKAKLLEIIQWMSGSNDFAPGGKARKGFNKMVKRTLEKQSSETSPIVENPKDPRQLPMTERQKPQLRVKPNKTVLNWGMKT